jgi:hypothetical protein
LGSACRTSAGSAWSHALDQRRDLFKRHTLISEGFDQQYLLLGIGI